MRAASDLRLSAFKPLQLLTQQYHFAHDHQRRRMNFMLRYHCWQVSQGARKHALPGYLANDHA